MMRLLSVFPLLAAGLTLFAAPLQNTPWQTPAEAADESKQQELDENMLPVSPKNGPSAGSADSRRQNTVVTEENGNVNYPSEEPDRKKSSPSGSSSGRTVSSRESRQPSPPASLPKIDRTVQRRNLIDGSISSPGRNSSRLNRNRGDVVIDGNSVALRRSSSSSGNGKTKIIHGKINTCQDQVLLLEKCCPAKIRKSGSSCKSCK